MSKYYKVHDKRLLKLIGRYLRAGVMVEGVLQPTPEGWPGHRRAALVAGPLSPLLSNILLDDLDKELERRGLRFVRYADDFQIFVKNSRSAQRVFESVQRYVTQTMKLSRTPAMRYAMTNVTALLHAFVRPNACQPLPPH